VIVEASVAVIEIADVVLSELEVGLELAVNELDIIAEELDEVTGADDPTLSVVEVELTLPRELELETLEAASDALLVASTEEAPMKEVELFIAFPETLLMAVEMTEDAVVAPIELELVTGTATEVLVKAKLELEFEAACRGTLELEPREAPWLEGLEATATDDELLELATGIEELVLELDELPAVLADEDDVVWLDELIVVAEDDDGTALLLVEAATRDRELLDELIAMDDVLLDELGATDDELLDEPAAIDDVLLDELGATDDELLDEPAANDDELLDELSAIDDELLDELSAIDNELLDELGVIDDELLDELAAMDDELLDEIAVTSDELAEIAATTEDELLVERASDGELVDRLESLDTSSTDDDVLAIELEEMAEDAWFDCVTELLLEIAEIEELGIGDIDDPVLEVEPA